MSASASSDRPVSSSCTTSSAWISRSCWKFARNTATQKSRPHGSSSPKSAMRAGSTLMRGNMRGRL